ncbi:MAG: NlpC/P60 family protein [Fimbriimonas sp.]
MVCACSAFAGQTHTVQNGDTISEIAHRYKISQKDLLHANGLTAKSRLKLGMKLTVPGVAQVASISPSRRPAKQTTSVVAEPAAKVATKTPATPINPVFLAAAALRDRATAQKRTSTYVVRPGDNDWIIAKHTGTTPKAIRQSNPTVAWNKLKPGMVLTLPSGAAPKTLVAQKLSKPVTKASGVLRSKYAVVVSESVAVRKGASSTSPLVARVGSGTRVVVLGSQGDWVKARFPKGTSAWVRGDFLQPTSAPAPAPRRNLVASNRSKKKKFVTSSARYAKLPSTGIDLLDKANSFRGVRYHYGSASRSSTDCSGFTSQVFRAKGVALPRTSGQQAKVGATVDRSSLKAGDLLFFRTGRARRINHVAIYMGQGKFIHASSGGGKVQVNSLKDSYYNKRFVTAKRVAKVVPAAKKQVAAKPKPAAPKVAVETTSTNTKAADPGNNGE